MRAVIAGVSGAVGGAIARELAGVNDVRVSGLARRAPSAPVPGQHYLQVDLSNPASCTHALANCASTHLYYCARATHAEQQIEDIGPNVAMLENLLDVLEPNGLRHVHLVQGGKVYGVHLGPFETPAREDGPRAAIPNFNHAHEDLLKARSAGQAWSWTASRPNTLVHFAPGNGRNLVSSLGAYAALCRARGGAFDFPGPEAAFHSLTQVTAIELLARGTHWMSRDAGCANQAFNLTNGDVFRWSRMWPFLADAFDLPYGSVRPTKLADSLTDADALWAGEVVRHGLQDLALHEVANFAYLDATLERTWDEILSMNKARAYGFHDWADSETLMLTTIQRYRAAKILP